MRERSSEICGAGALVKTLFIALLGVIVALTARCTLLLSSTAAAAAELPNVVVIVIDDLGWADISPYGKGLAKTPNLQRLASRGMRFTQGYAACPVCSPTRAALLTGRYPARLHLTDWLPGRPESSAKKLRRPVIRQELPLEEITLAEALRPAGYVSASIGKWHLGGPPFWPEHQGFDVNIGGTATGSPPGGYFQFKTPNLSARDSREYLTDRLTDEAVKFIDKNADRPFFLYLPHYAVHIPLQAKSNDVARLQSEAKPDQPRNNAIYAAMIESMDESVGRIVTILEDRKIADKTVIVFTSDNGGLSVKEGPNTPATTNAPLRAGKGYLYEGGIRVPWIVVWPGVTPPGSDSESPISSVDLFPSILEMAGLALPANRAIDGESLVPLLTQRGTLQRSALYWHYPHYSNQGGMPGGAVRSGDLKLIEFYEDGRRELYDLRHDPSESRDLAGERAGDVQRLASMLADWRKSVAAQVPMPNPEFRDAK
jgi:arylsulfatase A